MKDVELETVLLIVGAVRDSLSFRGQPTSRIPGMAHRQEENGNRALEGRHLPWYANVSVGRIHEADQ